ncbi:MAG: hypothetical protein JWP89_7033 [Schlesneria sp.]|nr:hypothetical protein [Schlesneria sp.]
MRSDIEQLRSHQPSGLVLCAEDVGQLQKASSSWYNDEITRQGKIALNRQLGLVGVRGEKSSMSFLEMTRAQVQTLVGNKGKPTRENLDLALRRTGTALSKEINETRKREVMIKKAGEQFRLGRIRQNEPHPAKQFSPSECDKIVQLEPLPRINSFFRSDEWLQLVDGLQTRHHLSLFDAITVADWLFARMLLDGFRMHVMTAIHDFGDVENVNLRDPIDSPAAKVAVILKLYAGFKHAPNHIEVARRVGVPKSKCNTLLPELIDFCGLEMADFESTATSLPLLLLKSEGTATYVTDCLVKMASRRGGFQDVAT